MPAEGTSIPKQVPVGTHDALEPLPIPAITTGTGPCWAVNVILVPKPTVEKIFPVLEEMLDLSLHGGQLSPVSMLDIAPDCLVHASQIRSKHGLIIILNRRDVVVGGVDHRNFRSTTHWVSQESSPIEFHGQVLYVLLSRVRAWTGTT